MDYSYRPHDEDEEILQKMAELLLDMVSPQPPHFAPQIRQPPAQKQSPNLQVIHRLYQRHRENEKNLQELKRQKMIAEGAQLKTFKVENTKSKEILKKNPSKPIFQRTQQILREKQRKIFTQRMQKEEQEELEAPKSQRRSDFNMKQFLNKQVSWQLRKNENINLRKMEQMAKDYSEIKDKPDIRAQNHKLLNSKNNEIYKKQVLDRFDEYDKISKYEKASRLKTMQEELTPFTPKISEKSRIIASRSTSALKDKVVFERISGTPTRRCSRSRCLNDTSPQITTTTDRHVVEDVTFDTPRSKPLSSTSRAHFHPNQPHQNVNSKLMIKEADRFELKVHPCFGNDYENIADNHQNPRLSNYYNPSNKETERKYKPSNKQSGTSLSGSYEKVGSMNFGGLGLRTTSQEDLKSSLRKIINSNRSEVIQFVKGLLESKGNSGKENQSNIYERRY